MIAPQLDDNSGVGILGAVYIWSGFIRRGASHHSFDPISYDLVLRVLGNGVEHPRKQRFWFCFHRLPGYTLHGPVCPVSLALREAAPEPGPWGLGVGVPGSFQRSSRCQVSALPLWAATLKVACLVAPQALLSWDLFGRQQSGVYPFTLNLPWGCQLHSSLREVFLSLMGVPDRWSWNLEQWPSASSKPPATRPLNNVWLSWMHHTPIFQWLICRFPPLIFLWKWIKEIWPKSVSVAR